MTLDKTIKVLGTLALWIWFGVQAWRAEQRKKAEPDGTRGTVRRRRRVLDRIALVFTALVVASVAAYAAGYGERWMVLVFVLVFLAFTVSETVQRRKTLIAAPTPDGSPLTAGQDDSAARTVRDGRASGNTRDS